MSKRLFLHAAAAAAGGALLTACGGGGGGDGGGVPIGGDSLAQLLQTDSRLSLMREAAAKGSMAGTLGDAAQNLTLFAAENAAFDALAARLGISGGGSALVDRLSGSQWNSILRYALLPQRRSLSSLANNRFDTLYDYRGDTMQLIFVTANGEFNVWDGVGRYLITVPRADLAASNGVMHVTSDLVLPRGVLTVSQMLRANIDSFSGYGGSMSAAVISELDGAGRFSVFVPFNGTPGLPLASDNAVRHHVMTGEIDERDFVDGMTLTPLFGRTLTLRTSSTETTLRYGTAIQARVTDVDFYASNGVIHVIDAVIPL
jgi:uncharacterized surface protein with fasciclin (FAS1) repeats